MSTQAGKIAEVMFESVLDTYEDQTMLVDKTQVFTPESGTMQNAGNVIWRPKEQHAPIIDGWDLTGQEQSIIEETYPAFLGTPKNDFVKQRIDDLRDMEFWSRRGAVAGRQQATELNKSIANLVNVNGSMYYESNATSGFDFISEGQALMNERQGLHTERCYILNDRSTKKYAEDLAGRQTIKGRPADAWSKGQIGSNVAEFDIYTGSFLPTVAASTGSTTTTATYSGKPEGGSVDSTSFVVTNVDYRTATIAVTASAGFAVGDKVTFTTANDVNAVGLADKTDTGQLMTFTITAIPNGTSVTIFPKPIAADDAGLSVTEKAYANVDTQIVSGATMVAVNTTGGRANLFYDNDAIEVVGGNVPMNLMSEFDGMKVISETMSNGLNMYMVYDANLDGLNLRYRLFTWYGLTAKDPSRMGVSVSI
tara:strand:+ start:17346 stop:18614 length:1269 start_codon:yes stop_codon:yes gene_type:complete